MANVLSSEKQQMCLKMLVEGNSIRSLERTTEVHLDTIMRLMVRFGEGCAELLDSQVRRVETNHVEIDEQWTWVGKKQGNLPDSEKSNPFIGDQYLFLAQEQDSRLIISYRLGKRTEETTVRFMEDLEGRIVLPANPNVALSEKPQFSTDGFLAYPNSIIDTFGSLMQHGGMIKKYENEEMGRYAPPEIIKSER